MVLTEITASSKTAEEPKQVAVYPKRKIAAISCMKGRAIQFFSYSNNDLKLIKQINFADQCVEAVISGKYCFVTATNFSRFINQKSYLIVVDLETLKVVSKIDTRGVWSKAIAVSPKWKTAFVSNWRSNDISVVDISDVKNPQIIQLIPCGKSPRGMAISKNSVWVAGYYSRNISEIQRRLGRKFEVFYTTPPFDSKKYQGNMRDILISKDGEKAYISNMGRNLVHIFSVEEKAFTASLVVGKYPNSLSFADEKENKLIVSCRKSNSVYVIDLKDLAVAGRSQVTGEIPTGLASIKGGFLSTSLENNKLELHKWIGRD